MTPLSFLNGRFSADALPRALPWVFSLTTLAFLCVLLSGLSIPQTATARPCLSEEEEYEDSDNSSLVVGADWLYWKIREDGLNLFTHGETSPEIAANINSVDYTPIRPHFKYESGARGYLCCRIPGSCYDIAASYSHIPATARATAATPSGNVNSSFLTNTTGFPVLVSVSIPDSTGGEVISKWNTKINCLDVDIGRNISIGRCLKFRPHLGFRWGWMEQVLSMDARLDSASTTLNLNSKLQENFVGVGVKGGLWLKICTDCGISVIGHLGGSALYSEIKLYTKLYQNSLTGGTSISGLSNTKEAFHVGTPTIDYFVGLQYTYDFCRMSLSVILGWEQHFVFQVNKFSATNDNLSLGGGTMGLNLGF